MGIFSRGRETLSQRNTFVRSNIKNYARSSKSPATKPFFRKKISTLKMNLYRFPSSSLRVKNIAKYSKVPNSAHQSATRRGNMARRRKCGGAGEGFAVPLSNISCVSLIYHQPGSFLWGACSVYSPGRFPGSVLRGMYFFKQDALRVRCFLFCKKVTFPPSTRTTR